MPAAIMRTSTGTACVAPTGRISPSCSAQQLGPEGERKLGDLVEEERAAVRGEEEAVRRGACAGERALAVAEEHRLHHGLGQRSAVDGNEVPVGAWRIVMQEACNAFLAGARLALDEDSRIAGGNARGKTHQSGTALVAHSRHALGAQHLGDQRESHVPICITESDARRIAIGGRHQPGSPSRHSTSTSRQVA